MFHFRKDFSTLTRDYRAQDESGLPEITPVVIADDTREMVYRTRPTFAGSDNQAAVAAVFSLVGIEATTVPIRVKARVDGIPATGSVRARLGIVDLRTANQGVGTIVGLDRGQAVTALINTGTTTVTFGANAMIVFSATDTHFTGEALWETALVLRPGEFLTFQGSVVNEALNIQFFWEELLFGLPANPPNLI